MKRPEPHVYSVNQSGKKYNALSFLAPDVAVRKGLSNEGIIGVLSASATDLHDPSFRANPAFINFLHGVIARHGPSAPGILEAIRGISGGWMQIADARAPQPRSEAESEDILGEFEVREGSIVAGSYTANQGYRVVGKRGFMILDPWMHEKLMEELAKLGSQDGRT